MALSVTLVFIAVFALMHVPMTAMVGYYRAKTGIELLDGGNPTMLRRMRAHGNFTETVPIALLAMAAAELSGTPALWLWIGGWVLLAGRLVHCYGMLSQKSQIGRSLGMGLTLFPTASYAILTLLSHFSML